jgi:hypothetical protein
MNTVSVVALMCHVLAGSPPLCHEVVVGEVEGETTASVCGNIPALAQWKANSQFSSDDWYIGHIRCDAGKPAVRDAI